MKNLPLYGWKILTFPNILQPFTTFLVVECVSVNASMAEWPDGTMKFMNRGCMV